MNPKMNDAEEGVLLYENMDLLGDLANDELEGGDEEASKEREDILK